MCETNRLGTLPEELAPDLGEITTVINDRQEVVACQLAHPAGEEGASVWQQQLRLAEPRWVPEDLPRGWVARGILMGDAEIVVAEWNPAGLTTPACLDELPLKGKTGQERGDGPWSAFGFENGGE